jgi:uncharacterized RDD family membrane protein YckC
MSDPTAPPPGGEQYPPSGGYPPQQPPPSQPPPGGEQYPPAGGYPPPQGGYPPQPGGYPPQQPPAYQQPYGQPGYGPPPQAGPTYITLMTGQSVKLADFGQRAIGRIIDAVIVGLALSIVYFIAIVGIIGTSETTFDPDTGEFETTGLGGFGLFAVTILVLIILSVLYEVAFVAVKGQTPGKMIVGNKVVDQANGELIGWGPAFMRWLPIGIGNLVCGLGWLVYFTALLDKSGRLQGWHDNMAKDLVISLK